MRKHIRRTSGAGIALAFIMIAAPVSAAQVDYFLKIDGIKGESQNSRHPDEIEILSWSWGCSQSASDGSVDAHDFLLWQRHSRTTPLLAEALLTKKELTSATLVGELQTSQEPVPYLIIRMKPVYITSYQTGGSSGDVVPVDQISMNYTEIKYEYRTYDEATSRPLETFTGGFDKSTGVFLPD